MEHGNKELLETCLDRDLNFDRDGSEIDIKVARSRYLSETLVGLKILHKINGIEN